LCFASFMADQLNFFVGIECIGLLTCIVPPTANM
jgi:hypothetical protein